MIVTIIGVGLIGGSMALKLKEKGLATRIIGVDTNPHHGTEALSLGLVDEMQPMEAAIHNAQLVIVAIPVNAAVGLIPRILDNIDQQVVMDVGSTKQSLSKAIAGTVQRSRFVATHPMWGTEFSGPSAADPAAFTGKAVVICDRELSDADALETVEALYKALGMHLLYMDAPSHDLHAAYVSHISHISSFALANTVLEKEKEEEAIFEMASGGFESTVRLAKSSVETWVPIFRQNRLNVLDVLQEHISQLREFEKCLQAEDYSGLAPLIKHANTIKRILK